MGSFYSGFGGHKSYLGHCEGGIIYSGSGNRTPIGRYENGSIYNQFKEYVGSYSGGSIYNSSRTHVASYDGGTVYNSYLNATVGREQIGSYDDNPAEAAALVLLFLSSKTFLNGESGNDEGANESPYTTTYSSNSESGGFLETVFALVGAIFYFIVRVTIFQLVYIQIPGLSYCTLSGWICLLIGVGAASIGLVPVVYILLIPLLTIILLFFPYYIFAIAVKVKIKCSKIEFLKFFWKWFLKGPLAYPELINVLEENNIMPKATKTANKVIDFFKRKFSKK